MPQLIARPGSRAICPVRRRLFFDWARRLRSMRVGAALPPWRHARPRVNVQSAVHPALCQLTRSSRIVDQAMGRGSGTYIAGDTPL
jgi:hypothetical protein